MVMSKPMKGRLRRSRDPALWLEYRQSASNSSVYVQLHRLQASHSISLFYLCLQYILIDPFAYRLLKIHLLLLN